MNFTRTTATVGILVVAALSFLPSGCSESRECLKWTTTLVPNTTCTSYVDGQCRGWSYGTRQVRVCEKYADAKKEAKR